MMDTSKEYIKMCDCPEIQDKGGIGLDIEWLCEYGDYYVTKNRKPQLNFIHTDRNEYKSKSGYVWLPRQDQLQDMVIEGYMTPWALAIAFQIFIEDVGFKMVSPVNEKSMEQLWISFVMQEKFKKRWDGDKWVSDSDQN